MTTPQAAVFDLGGVVFRYLPERRLAAFAELTGLPAAEVSRRLIDSGYSRQCDAGRLRGDAVHAEGIRLLGRRIGPAAFRQAWLNAFEPDPAVVALVRGLKPRLPVALLSNNSDLVRDGLEAAHPQVLELFRPRLFSVETGLLKPDPRLFATLLDLLGLRGPEVLYIDDEPACVAAAAALGFHGLLFAGAEALADDLTRLDGGAAS